VGGCSGKGTGTTLNRIAKPDSQVQPHKFCSVDLKFFYCCYFTFEESFFILFCFAIIWYFHIKGQKKDSKSSQERFAWVDFFSKEKGKVTFVRKTALFMAATWATGFCGEILARYERQDKKFQCLKKEKATRIFT